MRRRCGMLSIPQQVCGPTGRRGSVMAGEPLPPALSERDHQRLFWHEIAPLYFPEGLGRAAAPTAALLGGQPGAGRTRLLHEVTAALTAHGPTVIISGADLRPFHPADGRLPRTASLEAAHAMEPDTRRWVEMLIAEGRHHGVHLVIDSTLSRPEVFAHRAGALRTAGYRVEAHVLAVSPEWGSRHRRFLATFGDRGPWRHHIGRVNQLACLLPDPSSVRLETWSLKPASHSITLTLNSRHRATRYPLCGRWARRVHNRYER